MMAKLINTRTGHIISEKVIVSKTFLERSRGLLGKDGLDTQSTMWFPSCNSIHTWFMKFSIDVVFVDRSMRVRSIYENVKPWRLILPRFGWKDTFEFAAGVIAGHDIKKGDLLDVTD